MKTIITKIDQNYIIHNYLKYKLINLYYTSSTVSVESINPVKTSNDKNQFPRTALYHSYGGENKI